MSNKSPFHRNHNAPTFNAPKVEPRVIEDKEDIEIVPAECPDKEKTPDPEPIPPKQEEEEEELTLPEKIFAQYCGKARDNGEFYKKHDHIWSYKGVYYGHKHLPKGVSPGPLAKKRSVML